MGACASVGGVDAGETERNKRIQKEMAVDMKKQEEIIKLLLLGAGESGKSTIFKQMKILYGKPWSEEELESMRPVVFSNIVQNLKLVCEHTKTKGSPTDTAGIDKIIGLADDAELDAGHLDLLKSVWSDPAIVKSWETRSSFQVLDCLEYYMNDIERIVEAGYVPTQQDILQARVRTSGIVEERYIIDGVNFTMFDVGGQRNERKKWIHCFDNVTAVIFVAAINEYDQVLYEDSQTNRIDEAIKLFDEICNSSWFRKTSMILFLNKSDLFVEKLFKVPLRVPGVRHDDFQGPYAEDEGVDREVAVEAAQKYLISLFTGRKKDNDKEIYSHMTCATDTHNVQVVFSACKDIILRRNLIYSGFMD